MWKKSITIGSRTLEFETGKIAKQAHGAILLREGKTVILSTLTYGAGREGLDFFPLTVDYKEYHSANGKIPGSFMRREGRSSDQEVLASRFCDRSIRPLFPKGLKTDTQLLSTVHSFDPESDAATLAINSGAAAIHMSELPFAGPLAAIRVARVDGKLVAFPTPDERAGASVDLALSFSRDGVVMMEGGANQAPESDVLEAIAFGQEQITPLLDLMEELREERGHDKIEVPQPPPPPAFASEFEQKAQPKLESALALTEKLERKAAINLVKKELLAELESEHPDENGVRDQGKTLLGDLEARMMREKIIKEKLRVDGRGPEDIRPIDCEVDWLPSTHGSALFTRGETQAIVTLTLGSNQDRMLLDGLNGVTFDRFMLHYNFPSYSVGEVRPNRGPGRREVGHGFLARRALQPVLPTDDSFPYTVRIVSEISESNGSSSMATVCGGTLALMDGGVPISAPVAGIAMGMIKEGEDLVILSDILGDEDHLGDMDFKVAGTGEGITAIQMDNKIGSLPAEVMGQAFEQARQGRIHILAEMAKTIEATRSEYKPTAPLIMTMQIATDRIRDLIGPGGKIIQQIQRDTECRVEVDDSGTVRITAPNKEACDAAEEAVMDVAGSPEEGTIYDAVVTGVKDFGAFVKIRGYEGLVHVSEWDSVRVEDMSKVAEVGDKLQVKVMGQDKAGRWQLSRKATL